MPETPLRNLSIRRLSFAIALCAVAAGSLLFGTGVYFLTQSATRTSGAVLMTGGLILGVLTLVAHAAMVVILMTEANVNRIRQDELETLELLRRVEPMFKTIADNSQISDIALSITHREQEREALRQAIREEMYSGDWEAVYYLIDEMERRFGYKQEALALRAELNQVREMTIEEKIKQAISHIEKLTGEHQWDRARLETERLMKLFPRHERILGLPAVLAQRREAHKQELLAEWRAAVERNEIDRGIVILTALDQYLSRQEAQSLQESARGVFKARLLNLGVQFSLAVSESRWRDALEVGLQLRQEFPNSRMAQEVTQKLDTLRTRAGFAPEAEVTLRRETTATP